MLLARRFLLLLALLLPLTPAAEEGAVAVAGEVLIEDAWARATLGPVRNSAAYMRLVNRGDAPDRLVGATSPRAGRVELHAHLHEGGVVRMRQVAAIEVAPGEVTVLQPGGLHVMLVDLEGPLAEGDRLPLTLTFERGGEVDLDVPVRGLTSGRHAH